MTYKLTYRARLVLTSIVSYCGVFLIRDLITGSSAHLSRLGYFTGEQYSTFVALNYLSQSVSRLASGLLIDYTNKPKLLYLITAFIGICAVFFNTLAMPFRIETVYCFGIVYMLVKVSCSFSRNCLLKLIAGRFEHKAFGILNNILAGFGALVNASAMFVITAMYRQGYSWRTIWIANALLATVMNIPFVFLRENDHTDTPAEIPLVPFAASPTNKELTFRQSIVILMKDCRFYILIALSCCMSIVRIQTSYITWYLMIMLGVASQDTPAISSIIYLMSVVSIFIGAYLNKLTNRLHNIITFGLTLVSTVALLALYYIHKNNVDLGNYRVLCISLMSLTAFATIPLNTSIDGIYALELSTKKTQSTAIGCSSAFGYLTAAIAAYMIKGAITNMAGWQTILLVQCYASGAVLALLAIYIFLRAV